MTIDEAVELAARQCDNRQFAEAEQVARQVLAQQPHHARAFFILAVIALYNLQRSLAKELMEVAINLDPRVPEYRVGYAAAIRYEGEFERAAEMLLEITRHWPQCPEAYDHLSTAYEKMRMMPEALATGAKAIALRPTQPSFHVTRATQLLMVGDYEQGWYEYEWRWFDGRMKDSKHDFKQPWWDGQAAPGQTLLLTAEQGMGDTFMAVRYASRAVEMGLRVVVGCQEAVLPMVRRCEGVAKAGINIEETGPFHWQLPLMSIMRLYATSPEVAQNRVPYMTAEPGLTRIWGGKLTDAERDFRSVRSEAKPAPVDNAPAPLPNASAPLRVGLAWCGNPRQDDNNYRSLHLADFAPLVGIPGVIFYGLQKGDAGLEANDPPPGLPFINVAEQLDSFGDTAALMMNLDLIITIDSSPAHLSGALARPTWVLICTCNAWQWLIGRNDSPWYPTARLFRQQKLYEWGPVIADVAEALRALLRERELSHPQANSTAAPSPAAI